MNRFLVSTLYLFFCIGISNPNQAETVWDKIQENYGGAQILLSITAAAMLAAKTGYHIWKNMFSASPVLK